ncbi:MAG TPA: DUF1800 family protein [Rhodanobacteraceae bacterium]|nr:DUF1800 family protein [Rhodanobacteraceae bacterium]
MHDKVFKGTFDFPPDAPASISDASRFLTQATFGPSTSSVAYLMSQGMEEWFDEQLSSAPTLSEPTVESVVNARTAGGQGVGNTQRLNRFFWQAAYAPDQLRQRMAFALSEIFVVSDRSSAISGDVVPLSHYQDVLAIDAFAPYSTLLRDVTYSPTMGKYLNAFHNIKPQCTGAPPNGTCTSPDENYAREVMQLFSVGLILLNPDHTPILDGSGNPIPTYDQTTITHTAKVFTGFTYSDAPTSPPNFYGGNLSFLGAYSPMACWGTELFAYDNSNMKHDITGDDGTLLTPKTVLGGATIPPGQTCADDLLDELAIISTHPNVAPFVSRQLIQRFVTSNPSPAYIGRVAAVFDTPGNDLGDVMKAILTDPEARTPPALAAGDSYGKLREPILRMTALWRAFDAHAPAPDAYGEIAMFANQGLLTNYGENVLESPTVFNFFMPDYQQPGTFANNELYSPEFQITNETTTYSTANTYYKFTQGGYLGMNNPPSDRPLIDLSSLEPPAAPDVASIVATINERMLYGTMSASMNAQLTTMLSGFSSSTQPPEIAWSAVYITMLSPQFAIQR